MGSIVAIGASWGGLRAVGAVLRELEPSFPAPIVVVQHRQPEGGRIAELLDRDTALSVREAEDKDELRPGRVLVAPADYHLLVEEDCVALSIDAPVRLCRPSVDVLLQSAAQAHRARAIGVILTGANNDGAVGLGELRRRGGIALVQDPDEAERPQMPRAALQACPGARVRPLDRIGVELRRICAGPASGGPAVSPSSAGADR